MKIIEAGHTYELDSFEGSDPQVIQFIHKSVAIDPETFVPINNGELHTVSDGTTNEEVLAMMIDRMKHLNTKFPCRENSIVITKLEEALMWLEHRTKDRVERGVEGKHEV